MKDFLQQYHVHLTTVGPVFIGSGRKYSKKEYMFMTAAPRTPSRSGGSGAVKNGQEIGILDIQKMYDLMQKRHLERTFEQYLLGPSGVMLQDWLWKQHIRQQEIRPALKYTLDCGDTSLDRGLKTDVYEFIKDPLGLPYVPGSSLKGMFRTLLLTRALMENNRSFAGDIQALQQDLRTESGRGRMRYLQRAAGRLEGRSFRTRQLPDTRPDDAVNDVMAGFIVSDSSPLAVSDLVACQRYELKLDSKLHPLNVIRECIRPGTRIDFTISIDQTICPFTPETIKEAILDFNEIYAKTFLDSFKAIGKRYDSVYLGGGSGFGTKTVLYPALGKEDGIDAAVKIFKETRVPLSHGHDKDRKLGVSPHVAKFAKYEGKYLMMGECKLEFEELRLHQTEA